MEISDRAKWSWVGWPATPRPDPAAEEATALFDEYRAPLFRYLLSFGLPPQECEEVIQEVFLALFLHLRDEKPKHNLAGWIFRVGHNLGLKRRAKLAALKPLEPHADQPDSAPNAEQRLVENERSRHLRAVVAALAEQDRQCLMLRAEGLRYRDIAATLGVSIGTVAACLVRALDRLKRASEGRV